MKLLHTADWHVGKVLKGVERLGEQREVLAEIVALAEREAVDAVLVAGDIFESAAPGAEAQGLAWATLLALRATGAEVVVVAGNHDPAEWFDAWAPVFAGAGVTMLGRPRRPDQGGVVELPARSTGELLRVALLPFVSQRGVVRAGELLELDAAQMAGAYAERIAAVVAALTAGFTADAVNVVVAHATVRGGVLGGGERDAQTIFEYSVPATVFPPSASYVALGHLHRLQQLPAPAPVWYPGSPIAVDFGEEADTKHVVVVDASPGAPAKVRALPLVSPRVLRTVRGTVAELAEQAPTLGDALLRVVVTERARAGLADEVRQVLANALEVRVERADDGRGPAPRGPQGRTPHELFAAYLTEQEIDDPRLHRLFADLLDVELSREQRLMRPVRLVLDGFGAFRERTDIDFDDTDFFALVGATGSGKSTVVDAICFALYGSVPRYGDERLVGSAMSVGHQETRVRLTFEVAGRRYEAARVVRRDRHGRVTTKEARLESADGRVLAGRAKEMAPAVEQVLGLPFSHFIRCVVLPQGEFARFLHDRPADRQELLVALLDLRVYERVAQEANRRAAAAEAAVRLADQQLDGLHGATPEAVAAGRERVAQLAALLAELDEAAPRLASLDAELTKAQQEVAHRCQLLAALGEVVVPSAAQSLGAELDEARRAVVVADGEWTAATAAAEVAAARVARLPALDALRAAAAAHQELLDAGLEVERAVQRSNEAAALAAEAATAEQRAVEVLAEAEGGHEQARQHFAAHLLAERLAVGDPCPVCGHEVLAAVAIATPDDLGERRAAVDAARGALDEARERHRRGEVAAERAAATVEQLRAQLVALEHRLADHPDREAVKAQLTEAVAAQAAEAAAREAERACAGAAAARRAEADELGRRASALGAGYHAQRDAVAALAPPVPGDDVLAAWAELERWAGEQRDLQVVAVTGAEAMAAEVAGARSALLDGLVAAVGRAGVPAPTDGRALHRAVVSALATATEQVASLERDVELVARLTAEREAAGEERVVAAELGRLLSARGFERWLVAEALHRLAEGASATLHVLSGGQFSLVIDADGEFAVVDHGNGDELRPVRTLSGGETFQASLALALALADELSGMASGGATKLDAIFLDEGFGTLDPESLDTVAATIESLGTGGRMVGIVTHVRELAARVPVRYEVRKGPTTSTVERVAG